VKLKTLCLQDMLAIWLHKMAIHQKMRLLLPRPILPCKPEQLPPAEDVTKVRRKLEGEEKKIVKEAKKKITGKTKDKQ